jgi:hypothetical protein
MGPRSERCCPQDIGLLPELTDELPNTEVECIQRPLFELQLSYIEGSHIRTPLRDWTDELPHGGIITDPISTVHAPRFQGPLYHGDEVSPLRSTIEPQKTRLNAVDDLIGLVIEVSLPVNSATGQRVLRNFVIVARGWEEEDFYAWYEA